MLYRSSQRSSYCIYLYGGDFGREDKPHVVSVHHDQNSDSPGGEAPTVLEHKLLLPSLGILKSDVKHLAEVLSQVMGCGALN